VATAVLLDESEITTPDEPAGTGAESARVRDPCWPFVRVVVGVLQEIVAPTWIVSGVGEP
jgi:hypothetical protein